MMWNVQILERPNHLKEDDENKKHIKSEIVSWLEDLDFNIKNIKKEKENEQKR
jgi:hypothetical protein